MNSSTIKSNSRYLILISLIAAIGGFLFGYDWVVIGGAKPFYEAYFDISELAHIQGWVMGSAILGCLIGVTIAGTFADKYGRKSIMYFSAFIFIIASFATGFAESITTFIGYRILGGLAIGITSTVSPMYIAEVSPSTVRGKYVSINQLTIVLGILSAQVVNWMISKPIIPNEDFLSSWNVLSGWRWMFWACAIPAIFYMILLFFIPESPRWMALNNKSGNAYNVFTKLGGKTYATQQLSQIIQPANDTEDHRNESIRSMFQGKMTKILLIGIVIAVLQQWCGINVIFNYAQEIFSSAGYEVSDMLFNIVITGIVNVIFTVVGMYLVDRVGRKTLLIIGTIGLVFIYCLLGLGYFFNVTGVPMLLLVVSAIACYAMTLAPVTWVVISEIFPNSIRAKAMAVSTFALWSACFVLTFSFPLLNNALGAYGTFWLYGIICLSAFFFIRKYLPETKGKSLEVLESELLKDIH